MKGVILTLAPGATIVDLTHGVAPQQIRQAAFLTQAAWPAFPEGAVHVAVIDPGVGTERKAIAVRSPCATYIGPDNGVLSAALPDQCRPTTGPAPVGLPERYEARAIEDPRILRYPVSATFHGRDVFAPAAAHLAAGRPFDDLGPAVDRMVALPPLRAARSDDGSLHGAVLHIDRFGNVITDIHADQLPDGPFEARLRGHAVPGPVPTYAEADGLAAIVGSSGYLEVALPMGNAARETGARIGDAVTLVPRS
jgi:S-adenosylmethionine hydrolase